MHSAMVLHGCKYVMPTLNLLLMNAQVANIVQDSGSFHLVPYCLTCIYTGFSRGLSPVRYFRSILEVISGIPGSGQNRGIIIGGFFS